MDKLSNDLESDTKLNKRLSTFKVQQMNDRSVTVT